MSEGGGDVTKWLIDTFKKDDEFVQKLVDRQWSSIKNGLETEDKVLKKFIEKSGSNNFMTFPAGSIMDRYNGIDVVIDGQNLFIILRIHRIFACSMDNPREETLFEAVLGILAFAWCGFVWYLVAWLIVG